MNETNNDIEKIELKWWEIKQGITPYAKKKALEKKANKHSKRKALQAMEAEKNKAQETVAKNQPHVKKQHAEKKQNLRKEILPESSLFNSQNIPKETKKILENFSSIIASTIPLNSKQRSQLPGEVRSLSHHLTDERGERRVGYMNTPSSLTAYIHYFLRWNLVRLVKLFANLPSDFFDFTDSKETICLDAGSGPLTIPTALFLARPELRNRPLVWYCMDISQQALSYGENIFLSTAAALKCEAWKIVRVKGEFGTQIKDKVDFLTCGNVFNEIVDDYNFPPDYLAKKYTEKLLSYVNAENKDSRILIVEPGTPKASRFVSLMRAALMRKEYFPCSPCTHCSECPMEGKKGGKWCNFAFSTEDAPAELKKLSEKAGLPKERAVLSFLALKRSTTKEDARSKEEKLTFRIASDPIFLPEHKTGYYACSQKGLLLVESEERLYSGDFFSIPLPKYELKTDRKSGALKIRL